MFKSIKRFVTRALTPKSKSNTTLNDLPEEIIVKILEGIPENEIRNFRLISQHLNVSIKAGFGTTLNIYGSFLPHTLWQGHVTILKLKDHVSSNIQDLPPLCRLRELEIGGEMRLQTLVDILGESPNLRKVFINLPSILDLDLDVTKIVLDDLPARIETLEIILLKNEPEVESSLLQIFSQLPLSSLKLFTCIRKNKNDGQLIQLRRECPDNLSSFIKTILTKCRRTLRDLLLSRSYDWLEEPESIPIEREFNLKRIKLLWVGESRWLRSLIDAQRTRSGLKVLIIFCFEDLWVQGIIQEAALASKASLKILWVQLILKDDQFIDDEFNLRFLGQFSKLEHFDIKSGRDFRLNQGRRTLEEPLAPLILPPSLKKAFIRAPITFQTLQSFCALPALEEITLEGFSWVDWPTLSTILTELGPEMSGLMELIPSYLLDWNWLKNLLINCPSLKSIKLEGCVHDIFGINNNLADIIKKRNVLPGLNFEDIPGIIPIPLDFPNSYLLAYTTYITIDRPLLDRFLKKTK